MNDSLELFEGAARSIAHLVAEKNLAYGSSFDQAGEILKILYPHGIQPEQMTDALAIVRCLDKFFRIATHKQAFGEDPWRDVMGYSLLATTREQRMEKREADQEKEAADPGSE